MERAHPHHRAELGDRAPQGLTLRVFKGQGGAGTRGQGLAGVTHFWFPKWRWEPLFVYEMGELLHGGN